MMIDLKDIRRVFNEGRPDELRAVDGVTLSIETRGITVVRGPSGSGKTTLLSMIGCMARPTAGRMHLGDREITSLPEHFLTDIRRRTFGFIFQHLNLIRGITALENIMLPAYPLGQPHEALKNQALALLDRFGILRRSAALVEQLSGGEAQRVAIARALINDPQIIIADEPTAHLDTKLSRDFMDIIAGFKQQGKTVIIASHDPLVYRAELVDCLVSMRDGRLEEPQDLPS